jgi:adenylate cyclase
METILALMRSCGETREFHAQSARALVNMIGLDVGLVILHERGNWKVVARAAAEEDSDGRAPRGREFSQTVLRQVLAERRTFFQDLALMRSSESLQRVDAVVVSPIFRMNEELAGVLYGLRLSRGRLSNVKITPLEAQLVQLLAAAAGANLARAEATRTRTQFEQCFSPELIRELESNPALMEGQQLDVTILMSDLRGFSTLSERLGPEETCRLVRDVMERQTEQIVAQGGTIVSYLGDGILAMWNAPGKQADHAARACRAALAIQREIPGLNAVWQAKLGGPISIGVGINTGPAQVGNTGSTRKFAYGPLGNSVNLASRVEGATKHLQVPILITGSTQARVGDEFATRRLCKVRVVGIAEPVDLYEVPGEAPTEQWLAHRATYEAALKLYENRQWFSACQTLLPLLESTASKGKYDNATLKLMKRCYACLEAAPEPFEPVLELTSK